MPKGNGGLLAPYRILDRSGAEGALCGKIFADLGADVIKLEPPGGCPSRRMPPFEKRKAGLDASLWFRYYNARKRSITLNLDTPTGGELLPGILDHVDVVIETCPVIEPNGRHSAFDEAGPSTKTAIIASISGFGAHGAYSEFRDSEGVLLALSGVVSMSGVPDQEPCSPPHGLAYETASLFTAMGILAALNGGAGEGRRSRIGTTAYECAALLTDSGIPKASTGLDPRREGDAYLFITPGNLYRCKDGYVRIVAGQPRHWKALSEWMGQPDAISDPSWNDRLKRNKNRALINETVSLFTADKTKESLFEEGQLRRVPVTPVWTPAEFLSSEWAKSRGFVQQVSDAALGQIKVTSAPFLIDDWRPTPEITAPSLGQHNWDFYVNETGLVSSGELEYLFAAGAV
jgi:benzylsuccinate CoA-transferase BbsE subunit